MVWALHAKRASSRAISLTLGSPSSSLSPFCGRPPRTYILQCGTLSACRSNLYRKQEGCIHRFQALGRARLFCYNAQTAHNFAYRQQDHKISGLPGQHCHLRKTFLALVVELFPVVLQRLDGGIAVMSLQLYTADDLPAQPPPPRSGQAAAMLHTQNIEGSVTEHTSPALQQSHASGALPQPGRW